MISVLMCYCFCSFNGCESWHFILPRDLQDRAREIFSSCLMCLQSSPHISHPCKSDDQFCWQLKRVLVKYPCGKIFQKPGFPFVFLWCLSSQRAVIGDATAKVDKVSHNVLHLWTVPCWSSAQHWELISLNWKVTCLIPQVVYLFLVFGVSLH